MVSPVSLSFLALKLLQIWLTSVLILLQIFARCCISRICINLLVSLELVCFGLPISAYFTLVPAWCIELGSGTKALCLLNELNWNGEKRFVKKILKNGMGN